MQGYWRTVTDRMFAGHKLPVPTSTSMPGGGSPLLWIEEYNAAVPKQGEAPRHVPGARLVLEAADAVRFRLSGLLTALGADGAYNLLLLLCFLSANATLRPTVSEISDALGVTERQARERLLPLQKTLWDGLPLLRELSRDPAEEGTNSGQDYFVLSPRLIGFRRAVQAQEIPPVPKPAGREAVIAWSRSQYAVPLKEAEGIVNDQLGLRTTEKSESTLFGRLVAAGVAPLYAERLIATEPSEEIEKQLAWLPARNAKEPGRFLVAAVRGRYGPPQAMAG